jgi:hypothetical protein
MGIAKFQSDISPFWKKRGDCCTFIKVVDILLDDGIAVDLKVSWCTQLNNGWREYSQGTMRIREKEFQDWSIYFPRGEMVNEIRQDKIS